MKVIKLYHEYTDCLGVLRVAIRYTDDYEEDRPATELEAYLLKKWSEAAQKWWRTPKP